MLENETDVDSVCETLKSVLDSVGIDDKHRIVIAWENKPSVTAINGGLLSKAIITKFKAKFQVDYDKLNIQFT